MIIVRLNEVLLLIITRPNMNGKIASMILLACLVISCEKEESNLYNSSSPDEENIGNLPIVKILRNHVDISSVGWVIEPADPKIITFSIRQPVDHNDPNGPTFIQKGTLLHRDDKLPVIFTPSGYGSYNVRNYDLTTYSFKNNEYSGLPNILAVDHRYYGNDGKDFESLDPEFLNIEQAAKDLHRIVEIFKEVYNSKWISMGYSKGGRTCIYHKYFFPEDIDATLSFVAPITLRERDMRFYDFVKNIATDEEYNKMIQFQRLILTKRNELIPLVEEWYSDNDLLLDREADKVIESISLGYPFSYWQYRSYWRFNNQKILDAPSEGSSAEEIFDFLANTILLDRYSLKDDVKYAPYSYQAKTQLGYPVYAEYEALSDLLLYYKQPSEYSDNFDSQAVQDVINWLDLNGDNIIHFYGGKDPWTAAMYQPPTSTNALSIIEPTGDHLIDLNDLSEKKEVISKLEEWIGFNIEYTAIEKTKKEEKYFIDTERLILQSEK